MSVYLGQQFYPRTLVATLCTYIRDKGFIFTHCWPHCVHITETKVLSSQAVGYTVCEYNGVILTRCWIHCVRISETTVLSKFTFFVPCIVIQLSNVNHIILTRYWLHCVRISEATVLSSQRQQFSKWSQIFGQLSRKCVTRYQVKIRGFSNEYS